MDEKAESDEELSFEIINLINLYFVLRWNLLLLGEDEGETTMMDYIRLPQLWAREALRNSLNLSWGSLIGMCLDARKEWNPPD